MSLDHLFLKQGGFLNHVKSKLQGRTFECHCKNKIQIMKFRGK